MKKIRAICLFVLVVLPVAVIISKQTQTGSGLSASGLGERPDITLAQDFWRLGKNPFLRPWLKMVFQLGLENRELARLWTPRSPGRDRKPTGVVAESFVLTFPQAVNGDAGGGLTISSSVLLINNGGADASGTIFLRQNNGSPMVVSSNLGEGSQFEFVLHTGEVLRLQTDGQGPLQRGWVEVISDLQISGSGTFTISNSQGVVSEVGIGDSIRDTQLMVAVDTTEGKDTGVAICNPGNSTAHLTYVLKDFAGTELTRVDDTLEAGRQIAKFAAELFEEVETANFEGVLLVISDVPVAVVTLRTRGVNFTSLPAIPRLQPVEDDVPPLIFARIGDGVFGDLGFQTGVLLLNNSPDDVEVTIEVFRHDGEPLNLTFDGESASQFSRMIPAGCGVQLLSDGTNDPGVVGWIRVTPDKPLAGGATFSITSGPEHSFVAEVGVPASPVAPRLVVLAQESGGVSTGIALTNVTTLPATLRLILKGKDLAATPQGTAEAFDIIAETQVQLPASSHIGLFVNQLFPGIPAVSSGNFLGSLEITSSITGATPEFESSLAGLTLLARGAALTSAPVPRFVVNFGPRGEFRPATRLVNSSPGFCVSLGHVTNEAALEFARFTVDGASLDFSAIEESALVGDLSGRIFLLYLAGNSFATELKQTSVGSYSLISFDGASDWSPYFATLSNLNGGVGFQVEIESNSASTDRFVFGTISDICFEAGILKLPAEVRNLALTKYFRSQPRLYDDERVLESTQRDLLVLEDLPAGAPRIDRVRSSRVAGSQEILLEGSGFSSTAGANVVTVEGNSRVPAEVLAASANSLTVRLPSALANGPLTVEVDSKVSNPYQLDVFFAPKISIETSQNPATMDIEVSQKAGEIALAEFEIQPSGGTWVTSGFAMDQVLGSYVRNSLLGLEELELRVASSDSDRLLIGVVAADEEDPTWIIEITSADQRFNFRPASDPGQTTTGFDGVVSIQITEPIFNRPNGAFDFDVGATSLPRVTLRDESRFQTNTAIGGMQ